jgi:hypothetical protein
MSAANETQEISDLVLEGNDKAQGEKSNKENNERSVALAIRNQALGIFTDKTNENKNDDGDGKQSKGKRRSRGKDTEKITTVMMERENRRILELDIERRKVELEERHLKMEEERMQLEKQERLAVLQLITSLNNGNGNQRERGADDFSSIGTLGGIGFGHGGSFGRRGGLGTRARTCTNLIGQGLQWFFLALVDTIDTILQKFSKSRRGDVEIKAGLRSVQVWQFVRIITTT